MPLISSLGSYGIIRIVVTLLFLADPKLRRSGTAIAVSLILEAVLCNLILKPLVARICPFDVNTAVQLLVQPPTDHSFPSGHTMASYVAEQVPASNEKV